MENISLLVLGGVITFFATYIVESIKYQREDRKRIESFILRVRLELGSANEILDKLKSSLEYKNFFEFDKLSPAEK